MRDLGAWAVAMEVSSHALALDRVDDVRFRVAALTNVTRDHLDFHQTLEAYAAAKRRLFHMAQAAVLNVDDEHGARWLAEVRRSPDADLRARAAIADLRRAVTSNPTPRAASFEVDGTQMRVHLPGLFNVAQRAGRDRRRASRSASILRYVRARLARSSACAGRMEHVGGGDIDVVVDYSHTPDALENALIALRETTPHKLAVVFGCGGDRDRGKRPEMGRIAAAFADRIYVTSDNPRSEKPASDRGRIETGIGAHPHVAEVDRRTAIRRAIDEAAPGDVVVVAGKGHETYQIIGDADAAVRRRRSRARGARRAGCAHVRLTLRRGGRRRREAQVFDIEAAPADDRRRRPTRARSCRGKPFWRCAASASTAMPTRARRSNAAPNGLDRRRSPTRPCRAPRRWSSTTRCRRISRSAGAARAQFRGRVLAITGSAGKTTTKAFVAQLLATRYGDARAWPRPPTRTTRSA